MKILILNGPNLNLLGMREPQHYGTTTYAALIEGLVRYCAARGADAECFQSNHEGDLVDAIQQAYGKADGIVFNPGAYTHTSIALLDALRAVGIPTVEVHISDVNSREPFRRQSYIRPACTATIAGHGTKGYEEAVDLLIARLGEEKS